MRSIFKERFLPASAGLILLAITGCASHSQDAGTSSTPIGIQSAFAAKHPYATMNSTTQQKDAQGNPIYLVTYTNPDGTTRTATYTWAGALLDDK
jgi:YD repeat-containing protein